MSDDTRRRRMLLSFFAGLAIFAACLALDTLLLKLWPIRTAAIVDDVVMGLACGALVMFFEERRHQGVARRLSVIREMNHILRNELEIIEYSAYATQDREHIEHIRTCVGHIDWALREVLTGHKKPVRGEGLPPRESATRGFKAQSR